MRVDKNMGKECGPKDTWHVEEEKKLSEGMLQVGNRKMIKENLRYIAQDI